VRLAGLVWLLFASTALAQAPRRPSLQWTRGRGAELCIDPLTLRERVEALAGPVFASESTYAIEGHIEAQPGGYRLRLSVTAPDRVPQGERIIEHQGADCRAFDDAIVFLVALTIDPDLDLEAATGEPELAGRDPGEELLRELDASPPRPAHVEPAPPPAFTVPARTGYAWEGSLSFALAHDTLGGMSLGPQLGARFPITPWLALGAELRVLARVSEVEIDGTRSLRGQSFSFAPLLCARTPGETSLRACLGPEPSVVAARGLGFDAGARARLSVWGALLKLELAHRVADHWSLLVQTFLRVGLEDKKFVYDSGPLGSRETVARLTRWSGGVALGVVYRFGSGNSGSGGTHLESSEVTR
jgi:hypothetical protein